MRKTRRADAEDAAGFFFALMAAVPGLTAKGYAVKYMNKVKTKVKVR